MGELSLVAVGSLVLQGDKVPSNSLVAGVPAIVKRTLTPEEVEQIKASAKRYVKYRIVIWEESLIQFNSK